MIAPVTFLVTIGLILSVFVALVILIRAFGHSVSPDPKKARGKKVQCSRCGKTIRRRSNYCARCGLKLP